MKHFLLLIMTLQMGLALVRAQDVKDKSSKLESFTSKTGVLLKFIDYSVGDINLAYGAAALAKVRKVMSGAEVEYFYQVTASGQYGEKTGSIAYEDLEEIIKATQTLKIESASDASSGAEYLENIFITPDGFQVGYYLSKGKIKWYLSLDKYGSDNTIFVNDVMTIEKSFQSAIAKIKQLKGA